ncbi:MAG: thiamine-phosphate kinase [Rikenellaceae bacterium]|nr:thiamine-phosphate kinase [Rikenellaceae bacterium]
MIAKDSTGIGDDCAIIPLDSKKSLVVTTDMLVEEVHFLRDKIAPFILGKKSLAVNLSDIASMGAAPVSSFLSFSLPDDVNDEWRRQFIEGYYELSEKFSVPLLGGDTTRSLDKITVSVTALGTADNENLKRRNGAGQGDLICVNGYLGDSAAGFKLIQRERWSDNPMEEYLINAHNDPDPLVNEGLWLGKNKYVTSMMDISDGIGSDIRHILNASDVGAIIDLERLPLSSALTKISGKYGWDKYNLAVNGGEDYKLLFTVLKEDFQDLNKEYLQIFKREITVIGSIAQKDNGLMWKLYGDCVPDYFMGYRHF